MSVDAKFEDGAEQPLKLLALDEEDIKFVSALAQDSVFPASEMRFEKRAGRFSLLVNRFRWEDPSRSAAAKGARTERVQSVLSFEHVMKVTSQGISPGNADQVLSLLSIVWRPAEAPGGMFELVLAGEGAIRLMVEAPEILLRDVTRPYNAPSGKAPSHPEI